MTTSPNRLGAAAPRRDTDRRSQHCGKASGSFEIIRLVIAAGAAPSIANKSGRKAVACVKERAIRSLLKSRRRHRGNCKGARPAYADRR